MLKKPQRLTDDLFESSSMSFGEHLEELRKCLLKAFLWLGLGTSIGLYFGNHLVAFMKVPFDKAIREFELTKISDAYAAANNGAKPSAVLVDFLHKHSVVPERVWVDPKQFDSLPTDGASTLQSAVPTPKPVVTDSIASIFAGMNDELVERLVPVTFWRKLDARLLTFDLFEGFMIWLKTGLVAGTVIASPGIFWHLWEFLAAGLYPHERRYVYWYMPLSLVLFLAGVFLAFFVIFKLVISLLLQYNNMLDTELAPRLSSFMSFALFLPLGFGIAFQLPLVMVALNRFGVVSVETFKEQWRIAVLVIAFLSMVLSPPDIYSMLGLFLPLTALYFVGIFLCRFMPRGPGLGSQALDPQG